MSKSTYSRYLKKVKFLVSIVYNLANLIFISIETTKVSMIHLTITMHCNWPIDHAINHSSVGLNRQAIQVFIEV